MTLTAQGLTPITNPLNSVLVEKKLINVDQKFFQLVSLAEGLPRTEVIESGKIIGEVFVEVQFLDFQMILRY